MKYSKGLAFTSLVGHLPMKIKFQRESWLKKHHKLVFVLKYLTGLKLTILYLLWIQGVSFLQVLDCKFPTIMLPSLFLQSLMEITMSLGGWAFSKYKVAWKVLCLLKVHNLASTVLSKMFFLDSILRSLTAQ